jgi:hypothetical protein
MAVPTFAWKILNVRDKIGSILPNRFGMLTENSMIKPKGFSIPAGSTGYALERHMSFSDMEDMEYVLWGDVALIMNGGRQF